MDISSLYKSISDFTEDAIREHIREIRNLRRQFSEAPVRVTKKAKGGKKKIAKKPDISKLSSAEKQELLQKLLSIRGNKDGKTRS